MTTAESDNLTASQRRAERRAERAAELSVAELADAFRDARLKSRGELRQEYDGAGGTGKLRRRGTNHGPWASGADQRMTQARLWSMIEYVRRMHEEDAVIGQLTLRARQVQIQDGFSLDVQTGDPELDALLWEDWHAWAGDRERCDLAGEWTFVDYEQGTFDAILRDGDCAIILLDDGRMQFVEAHRIGRINRPDLDGVVLGVQLDANRRRVAYHVIEEHPEAGRVVPRVRDGPPIFTRDGTGVRRVFHCYSLDRYSRTRGLSAYHPIVELATMFEDVHFALAIKQQFVAAVVWFLERNSEYTSAMSVGETETIVQPDGNTHLAAKIKPGMFLKGAKGEKLTASAPNVPSTETMQHLRLLLQIIGLNVGLPLALATLDPGEAANFSGGRLILDVAKIGYRSNQKSLIRRLHAPLYTTRVRRLLQAEGPLADEVRRLAARPGVNVLGHRWQAPTWPYPQPLHDAMAARIRVKSGQSSLRRELAKDGADIDDVTDETVADQKRAILAAMNAAAEIRQAFPEARIDWRDLLDRDVFEGAETAMKLAAAEQAPAQP